MLPGDQVVVPAAILLVGKDKAHQKGNGRGGARLPPRHGPRQDRPHVGLEGTSRHVGEDEAGPGRGVGERDAVGQLLGLGDEQGVGVVEEHPQDPGFGLAGMVGPEGEKGQTVVGIVSGKVVGEEGVDPGEGLLVMERGEDEVDGSGHDGLLVGRSQSSQGLPHENDPAQGVGALPEGKKDPAGGAEMVRSHQRQVKGKDLADGRRIVPLVPIGQGQLIMDPADQIGREGAPFRGGEQGQEE